MPGENEEDLSNNNMRYPGESLTESLVNTNFLLFQVATSFETVTTTPTYLILRSDHWHLCSRLSEISLKYSIPNIEKGLLSVGNSVSFKKKQDRTA
jgi:hypothetical protein